MIHTLIFITLLASCSFQKESDKAKDLKKTSPLAKFEMLIDSDGDGESDEFEIRNGSDPFIAETPTFEGEFFKEMKVSIELYNKVNDGYETFDWMVKDGKAKLSWEDEERLSGRGSLYMETLLKSYAVNTRFKKNNFNFRNYNEGVLSHASPVMFEDMLLTISKKLLSTQRRGYVINRAEAQILSSFKISSKKFKSFRNPVFDVYYKSKNSEPLIFIESKRIDGTYSFNEDNEVYIQFESFDDKIINEALLSGGASFFLKLRDFTVYDTDVSFSSILEKITSRSVPLTIAVTNAGESEASRIETIYVGTDGRLTNLSEILKKAFKTDFLMTETSIDQIRGLSNHQRSTGQSGQNESLKWFVGTTNATDNVYSTLFGPNDGIGLAYISDKVADKRPIFVSRTQLQNGAPSTSGKLPLETRDIKIQIIPQKLLVPVEKYETVVLPDCPKTKNWETNAVTYRKTIEGWSDKTTEFSKFFPIEATLTIRSQKGLILTGNIKTLFDHKLINLEALKDKSVIITLSSAILESMNKGQQHISVELEMSPKSQILNIGALNEIGRVCYWERSGSDSAGHIKSGSRMGISGTMSGSGYSGREFFNQYDLDVHIFSY